MRKIRNVAIAALMASGIALLAGVVLQPTNAHASDASANVTASATGEVRRVDAKAGKVALKHDAIAALELPAMTLVYQVAPVLLVNINPGDRVRFTAIRQNGTYIVTEISK